MIIDASKLLKQFEDEIIEIATKITTTDFPTNIDEFQQIVRANTLRYVYDLIRNTPTVTVESSKNTTIDDRKGYIDRQGGQFSEQDVLDSYIFR
jgi:hypothetical protein